MKYSLGQLSSLQEVKEASSTYCSEITSSVVNYSTTFFKTTFTDKAIQATFKEGAYYIKFKIKVNKKSVINIKLKNNNSQSKDYQFIKQIDCPADEIITSSIVVHAENLFQLLVFEIDRQNTDVIETTLNSADVHVYSIINAVEGQSFKRIGLQAEPGSIFIINNEEVRMGRTGMFEFKNENVPIYNFSCIKASKGFILDYIEMSKEG